MKRIIYPMGVIFVGGFLLTAWFLFPQDAPEKDNETIRVEFDKRNKTVEQKITELDNLTATFIDIALAKNKSRPREIEDVGAWRLFEDERVQAVELVAKIGKGSDRPYQFLIDNITLNLESGNAIKEISVKDTISVYALGRWGDWRVIPLILKSCKQKKTDKEIKYFAQLLVSIIGGTQISSKRLALEIIQTEMEVTKTEEFLNNLQQLKLGVENYGK